jgi:hypothetical protein
MELTPCESLSERIRGSLCIAGTGVGRFSRNGETGAYKPWKRCRKVSRSPDKTRLVA